MEFGPTGPEGKLMLPHPKSNPNGSIVLWVWDRETNTWTPVETPINSICGGWAKLHDGNVGMFAGHYQTLGTMTKKFKQSFGMDRIVLFDQTQQRVHVRANLTARRWYPTALPLPSGDVWVPGGTGVQLPNGTWPKSQGADLYTHHSNTVQRVPLNARLQAAGIGNWYMGSLVLPNGNVAVMDMNMMQVINPLTGDALAEAPPLTGRAQYLVWEFPRMGPQVTLRMPVLAPNKALRFEFMAFGGSWLTPDVREQVMRCGPVTCDRESGEERMCADISVRIGLTVYPGGRHVFDDAWEVEQMPGPRCIFDGVLLPNGHVVLIGGQQRGIGDLTNATHYNGGNAPYAEPWIYNPDAPAGSRFRRTAAKTRIARLYHAVALLTSRGDILATGTSNAAFWSSADSAAFDRTALGVNEYRQEIYHPPYLFRPGRPALAVPAPPTWVAYGSTFRMGFILDGAAPDNITAVVLANPGGTTHNYAIDHRSQRLAFTVYGRTPAGGVLTIAAPPGPTYAPPGFYLLFLVAGEQYSQGTWVQLREPPPAPLRTLAPDAQRVDGLSCGFEKAETSLRFAAAPGNGTGVSCAAACAEARGSGSAGLRVKLGGGFRMVTLTSTAAALPRGRNCSLQLWARSSARAGKRLAVSVVPTQGGGEAALRQQVVLLRDSYCLYTLPKFTPPSEGQYMIQLVTASGHTLYMDDVETYCSP